MPMSSKKDMSFSAPRVSVICATYNHEAYIEQTLNAFVNQITDFPFVVYVGDDASSDRTPEIIKEFAAQYPDIIVPILRTENIGAGNNWLDLINRCSSPYLAFCDGDDYWTDPHKLQKQYDYLEQHPELRACFHNVEISVETDDGTWFQSKDFSHTKDGKLYWPTGNKRFIKKKSYTLDNYIPFGFVQTSSMFIRWDYEIGFPTWSIGTGFGDFPMWAVQVNTGKFGYLDEVMSVYRRTGSGTFDFSTRNQFWYKTKSGSITIDNHLLTFFTPLPHAGRIIAALRGRKKDDLAKLCAATCNLYDSHDAYRELEPFKNDFDACFTYQFPDTFSQASWKDYLAWMKTHAPLPPYNASLASKLRRIWDILKIGYRTIR